METACTWEPSIPRSALKALKVAIYVCWMKEINMADRNRKCIHSIYGMGGKPKMWPIWLWPTDSPVWAQALTVVAQGGSHVNTSVRRSPHQHSIPLHTSIHFTNHKKHKNWPQYHLDMSNFADVASTSCFRQPPWISMRRKPWQRLAREPLKSLPLKKWG